MSADVAQPPSPPRILGYFSGSRASSEHQHHQRQQSSGSSSLRLTDDTASDKHQQKSPQSSSSLTSSYLRHGRRRSDGTETGSIGYGSSAPLESETSYSSHPGYPASKHGQAKSPPSSTDLPLIQQPQLHHHSRHQNQPLGSPSSSASQSSSSTPSSGAYVDVSSSARLAGPVSSSSVSPPTTTAVPSGAHHRTGSRRPKNALIKTRTTVPVLGPSTSAWAANNNANINNNINNNNVINNNNNNNNINNNINNNNNVNNNGPSASSAESESGFVVDAEKGNAYYKGQLLGKGGFARVYLITDIVTKKQYACKIIPKHQMQKIHMQKIAREIMIHKELNHVNVVQMHHYFEDTLNVYMLLEACPKKSLVHVLKYRGKVTEPEARYYMKQMVTGVAYIHSQKIIHRDLKPGNMFLSEKMIVKIGDFGLATQPDGQRRRVTICGTPNFIAPEVLFKQSYSYEADVWALGCILYVLLVGQPPFDSSTLKETYARICGHRYKELDDATATRAGQDLVRWLLQPNPELRPPLELVKEHPYLTREYVPASLPDSCCYQAPRLPFDERIQPPPPLLGQSDFDQLAKRYDNGQDGKKSKSALQGSASAATSTSTTTAAGGGGPASAPSTGSAAVNKKKKKVSSWLASWRLPRLPRFRQRISSVLCLEARRKQAALAAAAGSTTPTEGCCLAADAGLPTSQITLMSRALEDCLTAGSARARTRTTAPPLVDHHAPLFVTKWIDYSNKYGLTFQLSDRSVGVLFNDSTKMSYTHDRRRVEYMTADDEVTKYNRERNVPAHLQEKLQLLRHFTDYMDKHLTEGGEVSMHRSEASQSVHGPRRSSRGPTSVPLMRRWLRTSKAIVMELSVPLLQMNFFEDHTKLIVSREPGPQPGRSSGAAAAANASSVEPSATERYLVTYIDGERRASTYWLDDLRDLGCGAELHERLLYVYKVAKEFAELDAAAAAQAR